VAISGQHLLLVERTLDDLLYFQQMAGVSQIYFICIPQFPQFSQPQISTRFTKAIPAVKTTFERFQTNNFSPRPTEQTPYLLAAFSSAFV
jgi:hypothetical protein